VDIGAFGVKGTGACGTDAVSLTGNTIGITGIVFAPHGRTSLTGNNVTIIANQTQFTGNNKTVKTGRGSTTQGSPDVGFDAW
jgi:hypothetical protein